MKQNAGWIVAVVVLSVMLILSMTFGATGIPNTPESADTLTPTLIDSATSTPEATSTPDLCTPKNIEGQVARVHSLTREFEDVAQILTSTLFRDTSVPLVQQLQQIRRAAEDQLVPACLTDLKKYQLIHMNARLDVFGTTLTFINTYGTDKENQPALNQLLEPFYANATVAARQYDNEHLRLLGQPTMQPITIITTTPKP